MFFVLNLTWNSFTSQNSKTHALFILGNDLLRYVLIDNLEVSFNFHLTFLQWPWLKCSLCSKSCFFPRDSRLFSSSSRWLELPITRTFFDFPWRFELSGVDCTYNGHKAIQLEKCRPKTTSTRRSSRFSTWKVRKPWGLGKAQNPNSPIITLHLRFTKGASDHKTPGGGGWRYSLIRPIRRFAALWARLKFYLTPKKCHSKTHNQKRTTTILCILLLLSSFLYAQP